MLDFSPSTLLRNCVQVILPLGKVRQLAVLGVVLLGSAAADAKIIYVNGSGSIGGNGTSWSSSFDYLQDALKVAVAGDSIYMAKGTYYPDEGTGVFGGDRELSFEIGGLKIYGGFAGTENSLTQRNVAANPTILSGEIFPITSVETQGYERYWSLHVVVLKADSTLDGVTVTKGRANGDKAPYNQGGGCLVPAGMTLTLANCTFRENLAAESGGAVWGKVVATNCTFIDNMVNNQYLYTPSRPSTGSWLFSPNCQGGAITGDVTATKCRFLANSVVTESLELGSTCSSTGGAISGTTIKLDACVFAGNEAIADSQDVRDGTNSGSDATAKGGAIAGKVTARNCTFTDNQAWATSVADTSANPLAPAPYTAVPSTYGGAIAGETHLVNCSFANNSVLSEALAGDNGITVSHGGAVYSAPKSTVVNCTFYQNQAEELIDVTPTKANSTFSTFGGAYYAASPVEDTATVISASTFVDNLSSNGAGVTCAGRVNFINNIFWYDGFDPMMGNLICVLGTGRISNRLYPTPLTETKNILKGGIEAVSRSAGSNVDFGDPPERTLIDLDPKFVDVANPVGPDGIWRTKDDGLRLLVGSPATSLGHPLFIPKDALDLDNDGNVAENIPEDAAGFVRIQNGKMELGAYELGDLYADPEIGVERPVGTALVDGVSVVDLSNVAGVATTFVIRNEGAGDLTGLALTCDGLNASEFNCTQPLKTQLAVGEITTFTVTFNPSVFGMRNAAIHINSNDADERPFDIVLKGSAPTPEIVVEYPVGTGLVDGAATVDLSTSTGVSRTFVIRNTGAGNLTQVALTCDGVNASDFKCTQPLKNLLASGESTTFTVTFSPTVYGLRNAAIHIKSNDANENPFDILLKGSAPMPDIGVEYPVGTVLSDGSSVINYGGVKTISSVSKNFTIRNSGIANLNILKISSSGTNAASFKVSPAAKTILAAGETTTFNVTFSPSDIGIQNADITIQSNDPDSESAFLIKVTGTGLGTPEIVVSQPFAAEIVDGATNNFGKVKKSMLHSKTFIVKNTGKAKLKNIRISLKGSPAFTKTKLPVTSLSPGAKAKFTVTFKPSTRGKKTAALQIRSNDADEGDLDINLVGTCVVKKKSKASDALAERGNEGSGGAVSVMTDSEGLKYKVLTVEKSANWTSTKHTVEVSSNLLDWFSGRKHTTTLVDNANVLKVRDDTPIQDGKKRYIRLK